MDEQGKEVKRLMTERITLVDGLLSVLQKKVQTAERELLKQVVEGFVDKLELTEGGRVRNTLFNKRLLANIDTIFDKYGKTMGVEMAKTIANGMQAVVNFGGEYHKTFTTKAKLLEIKPQVQETLMAWMGVTERGGVEKNGYLDKLIKDTTIKNQIKNMAVRTVIGQQGWQEAKQQIGEFVMGNKDKTGAMERYYRNFVYDTYSQVDRATGQLYADKLGFEYAIYEGGLIETSRKFCKDRNGKVFHRSEIEKWNPTVAKPPGYNPFTDCGGYGCRHHLNWIPTSLANILRPDTKGGAPAPVAPEPPKPAPIQPPKPKIAAPKKPAVPKDEVRFANAGSNGGAKAVLEETFRALGKAIPTMGVKAASLTGETLKEYVKQTVTLFESYKVDRKVQEIMYRSTSSVYGQVKSSFDGENVVSANFGHQSGADERVLKFKDPADKLSRQRVSRADPDKAQLSTITHEFAHVIGVSKTLQKENGRKFFTELGKIRNEYHEEISENVRKGKIKEASEIFLGKYASTNLDEFWAEAFTEYKLTKNPSKYAKLAGKLGDKYFKK